MIKHYRIDLIAIAFFFSVVATFFYQVALGRIPAPTDALVGLYHPWRDFYAAQYPRGIPYKNYLITDPIRQQIPWRKNVIDQWKMGQIPGWNPFSFSGTPLAANIQAAAFYPLNLLFFFFSFPWAWTALIVSQPLLAGVFLYAYLRHQKLSSLSSLYGAISWSFSGFMTSWLTWGTIVHVILWLPLILLAIDKLKEQRILWSVILVFGLCAQFFAGHAQIATYVVIVSISYAIWKKEQFVWIPLLIALVITSIQWVPLAYSISSSSRVLQFDAWKAAGWFLPWQHLAQFFAPDFFGNPATLNYWGEWNYGEFIGYISIVGIIFALFALLGSRKTASVKFWGMTLGITLLFLLPTPLAKLPYILQVPIFSSLQPTRLMAIVDFTLVILAAFGFEKWSEGKDRRMWYAVGIVGVIILILWVVTSILDTNNVDVARRNLILPSVFFGLTTLVMVVASKIRKNRSITWIAVVFVLIISVDLIRFGWKFTPFTSEAYFFPKTEVIEFLQAQPKPFRVMSIDPRIIPPNTLAFYGIESIEGYDPIYSSRYEEFIAALNRGKPDISPPFGFNRIIQATNIDSQLIRFMNVRFVLSLSDIETPLVQKVFQEGETRIYELKRTVPRAFLVESVRTSSSKQEIIEYLYSLAEPLQEAVVEESINLDPVPILWSGEDVIIQDTRPNSLVMKTRTTAQRFVVIANFYDPRWTAQIDGLKTKVYRTNYMYQGVVVPPGEHDITVQYR